MILFLPKYGADMVQNAPEIFETAFGMMGKGNRCVNPTGRPRGH